MNSRIDIVVRSTEIDVNGHVNNAKYAEYLEWGREAWYDQAGLFYNVLRDLGVYTVVVNLQMNFMRECIQGDRLWITCKPSSIGRTSYVFDQEITNQNHVRCMESRVTCVTVSVKTRKSCEVPYELAHLFTKQA